MARAGKQALFIYEQIASDIEVRIGSGEYMPGRPIPSIRELAAQHGVAIRTAQRAVDALQASGRVRSMPGVGVFPVSGCFLDSVALLTEFDVRHAYDPARIQLSYLLDILMGAKRACSEEGVLLMTPHEKDDPQRLVNGRTGFIIMFVGSETTWMTRWIGAILTARAPYMSLGDDNGLPNFIDRHTQAASETGLRYLYDLGHRRILMVSRLGFSGDPVLEPVSLKGVRDLVIRTRTVPLPPLTTGYLGETFRDAAEAVRSVLSEEASDRPSAIFAGTGAVVSGALQAVEEAGLRVPEECSVLGFLRAVNAKVNDRTITRVDNPREITAYRAVKELVKMSADGRYNPGRILVEPDIFEGDTCAAPSGELLTIADKKNSAHE